MPYPDSPSLSHLSQMLRQRLSVTDVKAAPFAPGRAVQDEVVTTNRLVLVLKGELNYTLEGRTHRWTTGSQFFVPAWARRVWNVPRRAPCEIIWCEFDDDGLDSGAFRLCWRKLDSKALSREETRYRELLELWERSTRSREASTLCLEGELKALLARFWTKASPLAEERKKSMRSRTPMHPQVKLTLRWLENHFHEPDALADLYRTTAVTPNYFRRHFQAAMKCTPQQYIERLRLRRARYLLHESDLLQKQIAVEVGYPDSHYFSRLYRRFWGHSPRRDRRSS